MAGHDPLPPEFGYGPFRVGDARAAGLGEGRLRGSDLDRPFHGVRAWRSLARPTSREFGAFPSAEAAAEFVALVSHCLDYAPLLRPSRFFSGETAARLWKCPLPTRFEPDAPLHVSVLAPGRAPRGAGVAGARAAATTPIVDRFGLPVSDPAATWLALASVLGHDDLVAVADHLVLDPARLDPLDLRPHTSIAELEARLDRFSAPGARAAASALPDVRQGSESRRETHLRLVLVRGGLPEPELNVDILDDDGRWLGRVDELFRPWKVIAEYDGEQHRTDSRQYDRDATRLENFARAGYSTARIRSETLRQPGLAVERVARLLRDRGWRP